MQLRQRNRGKLHWEKWSLCPKATIWILTELPKRRKPQGVIGFPKTSTRLMEMCNAIKPASEQNAIFFKKGKNYDEVFAPIVKHGSASNLLSIAVFEKLHVELSDIQKALVTSEKK